MFEATSVDTAIMLKDKCLQLLETSASFSKKDRISRQYDLTNIGYSRLSRTQKDSVIDLKLDLISKMEQIDSRDFSKLAYMYRNISQNHKNNRTYDSSILYAKKSLGLLMKMYDSGNINLTSGIYALAYVYGAMGKYDSSEYYTLQSLKIKQKWFGKVHPSQLPERELYANLLTSANKFEQAEEMLKINFELSKQKYGLYHRITGDNLFTLLQHYNWRRQYEKNIELYPLLIKIDSVVLGKTYDAAASIVDYGNSLFALGQTEEAIKQYTKSLEITEFSKGKDSFQYGMGIFCIAKVFKKKNQPKQALLLMDSALTIIENDMSENHPRIGNYQQQYASLLEKTGDYEQSNQYHLLAIKNYEINYLKKSPKRIAYFQKEYAKSLQKQGLKDSANVMMQLAEQNLERQRLMNKK